METNIILAGVGGQGVLSVAKIIGMAGLKQDLYLKQSEVHGMSQRGGSVYAHIRLSTNPIASDLIPKGKADIILSMEPLESLRYLPFLKAEGWLMTNTKTVENIEDYPDKEVIFQEISKVKNNLLIDAHQICLELHCQKSPNVVMLGAAVAFLEMDSAPYKSAIKEIFISKGNEIVEKNILAFETGFAMKS